MKGATITALALAAGSASAGRYCAEDAPALAKCRQMVTVINGQTPKPAAAWTCVQAADCVAAIKAGTADLHSAGASDLFKASEDFGVQLLAGEVLGAGADALPTDYFALAIVRADQDVSKGWESLRGLKSCHTGYGKTSGWAMPVGSLLAEGVFTEVNNDADIPNDTEIISGFFSDSCAPGKDPVEDGVTALCGICAGDCTQTATEPYQDYEGSYACLKAGAGDVAFTKQGIVPAAEEADYQLMCRDGKVAPLSDYKTCNLAVVPSHSVFTRGDVALPTVAAWSKELLAAAALPAFKNLFFTATANPDSLLFDGEASGLVDVPSSARAHIGTAYDAFRSVGSLALAPVAATGGDLAVKTATFCVTAEEEAKCNEFATVVNKGGQLTWSCIVLEDEDTCVAALEGAEGKAGTPDAVLVGSSTAVSAAQETGAQLVVSEDLGTAGKSFPTNYYALAIVRKDLPVTKGWESLRGLRSCHTGYRKTSGWQMPVGVLLAEGVLSYAGNTNAATPNDIYAVQQFFSESCAPSREDKPADGVDGICGGCAGDCTWTEKEPFQDYPGSFKCLKDDGGDVAFTKQGIVPAAEEKDYKLVCADGTTKPMANFESCNLARVPARAVMTGGKRSAARIAAMSADLLTAAADPEFAALFTAANANPDGLVFSDGISGLAAVESPSVIATVGAAYFAYDAIEKSDAAKEAGAVTALPGGSVKTATWCVTEEAAAKCESMVQVLNEVGSLEWSCLTLKDDEECIKAMEGVEGQPGTPDAIVVGSSTAVSAARDYGSQLVVSEDNGTEGKSFPTEYYALAIVKKDLDVSKGWESLRGKRSCHTGYRKTSGWQMPAGVLLSKGVLSYAGNTDPDVPNDIYAVQQFFSKSCAPSREDKPADGVNGICSGCAGDCTWTENEPFQDYPGSFKCLKDDGGDVAFTKQGIVPAAEEGNYKLVCSDGRTQPLANFETCNMARVPARAVLTGGKRSAARIAAMSADLLAAAANDDFKAMFFEEDSNPDGLVFSEGISGLAPVESSSVIASVGDAAFAFNAIDNSDTTERDTDAGDDGKAAETAAIVLGILLAVLLLAASALIFRMKKSNRRLSKELSKAQGHTQDWGAAHATKA